MDVEDGVHVGDPFRDGFDVSELTSDSIVGPSNLLGVVVFAAKEKMRSKSQNPG